MGREIVLGIIAAVAVISAGIFAHHMDTIRMQAWLDKKIIVEKWLKYNRIKQEYAYGTSFITTIEDVNEAEQDLRKTATWYNKKYKIYGYCCPPELVFELEE